jgi:hypothetical protein
VLAGRGSAAKQLGKKRQIAEKHKSEAVVKTAPQVFGIDFSGCELRVSDFILRFLFVFLAPRWV